jgi:hypothetical protein
MKLPPFLEKPFDFPSFYEARVIYPDNSLENITETIHLQMEQSFPLSEISSGSRIAIAVGSRGIDRIAEVVNIVGEWLEEKGHHPIIVPAMGSHGGATPEGQTGVLERLGVIHNQLRWPVEATMETLAVGKAFGEVPVAFGKAFLDADYSICINRIKPHTKFKGRVESGLAKMLTVGMGKHQGALNFHKWALKYGFADLLEENSRIMLENTNFKWGLALVENSLDKLTMIKGVRANHLIEDEAELLESANRYIPLLPVRELDALIIQQIGKEISGAGMDPNVTGRAFDLGEDDFSVNMKAKRVVVLDLTDNTKGNAVGIGNADIITQTAYEKMDYESTLMNALTGVSLHKAFIPITMPSDEKAMQCAFQTIGPVEADDAKVILIQDTLHLSRLLVSKALLGELEKNEAVQIGKEVCIEFTDGGKLLNRF